MKTEISIRQGSWPVITVSILLLPFLGGCGRSNDEVERSWEPLKWDRAAQGVWKASAGNPERIDLLSAAGSTPRFGDLDRLPSAELPPIAEKSFTLEYENKTYLRFPLRRDADIYGLGLDFNNVRQTGTIQTLQMDHWRGNSGRTHAPVPFFVSTEGFGVFVNSARYIRFYVGTGLRVDSSDPPEVKDRNRDPSWEARPRGDSIEVLIPADGADVYLFAGPGLLDIVRRFNLFCGGGVLPPKWGLGFTHRTPTRYTDSELLAEVDEFADRGFPLDFVGIEPGWHSFSYPCSFVWDSERFPDPAGFAKAMRKKGIRLNLWMNPYIAPVSPLYEPLRRLSASHLVWNGIIPDYRLEEARQLFRDHIERELLDIGVAGFKIDEVDGIDEWLWPDTTTFPSKIDAEQMRQIYGVLLQKLTDESYRSRNQRTYGLVRASNAGGVRFPYVIYNDFYSHEGFITALCNSSFSGVLWTPEVRSSKSAEEWLRRMQSVCFSPMAMLNAWSSGTRPWSFPKVEEEVREITNLRMRLLPYLYTAFAHYYFSGTPPVRAMQLVEGFMNGDGSADLEERRAVKDQFMVGDCLLVAPLFAGQETREVLLPKGRWYDFYKGDFVGEGGSVTVTPQLNRIPLLVKDGGMIPLIPAGLQMPDEGEKSELEVRHYGENSGSFKLYDDDGVSFNFEDGTFSWTELAAKKTDGEWRGSVIRDELDKPFFYEGISWRFMTLE